VRRLDQDELKASPRRDIGLQHYCLPIDGDYLLVVPECGGNSQIIRLKAEVLLLLRFANAHEI
jgi:hypothetical protein